MSAASGASATAASALAEAADAAAAADLALAAAQEAHAAAELAQATASGNQEAVAEAEAALAQAQLAADAARADAAAAQQEAEEARAAAAQAAEAAEDVAAEPAEDPMVAGARRITEAALAGMVTSLKETGNTPADVTGLTTWGGPSSTPTPPSGVSIVTIPCAPVPPCSTVSDFVDMVAAELGWEHEMIAGAGTPESYVAAFDSAIAKGPDVILGAAAPGALVGDRLDLAADAGIITISLADLPEPDPDALAAYDAYVSLRSPLLGALQAFAVIADSGGTANVSMIRDATFPTLAATADEVEQIMAQCAGCSLHIQDWLITDAFDPAAVDGIISGILAQNPDVEYLIMPYSLGDTAVIESLRTAGRSDVKVLHKDPNDEGLTNVINGGAWLTAASSLEWLAWAGIDQAIRGLTGAPYLGALDLGIGVLLFDADNAPSDLNQDQTFADAVDFRSEYRALWGIG
ncbi:MAG: sugar ABC transporter substrate-binding protein [Acidimicrobiia bacterium]|nr:sugar ABC transporter substrate-binding protein [Acidimicrobiia bacterium]MYC45891.1 sugar ABC transporter substrate-binding protein [Acidimicrobiia bacterium]MYI19043.1 sugar ABC transporter substrate-binding protein [Acidimicrobiia bacterium]